MRHITSACSERNASNVRLTDHEPFWMMPDILRVRGIASPTRRVSRRRRANILRLGGAVHFGRPLAAAFGFSHCTLGFADKEQPMKATRFQGRRGTNARQSVVNYRGPAWAIVMRASPSIVPGAVDREARAGLARNR